MPNNSFGESSCTAAASGLVQVRGAREHNLKDVDVDIPRDALVVFSGVSGSGKSSLAFGTLYAEAQRRYFESVSPYARRLIDQVGVPEVDSIEGLPPAVALQQQRGSGGARSSVKRSHWRSFFGSSRHGLSMSKPNVVTMSRWFCPCQASGQAAIARSRIVSESSGTIDCSVTS